MLEPSTNVAHLLSPPLASTSFITEDSGHWAVLQCHYDITPDAHAARTVWQQGVAGCSYSSSGFPVACESSSCVGSYAVPKCWCRRVSHQVSVSPQRGHRLPASNWTSGIYLASIVSWYYYWTLARLGISPSHLYYIYLSCDSLPCVTSW
jgi:hypothetical protein